MKFHEIQDPEITEGVFQAVDGTGSPVDAACLDVVGWFEGERILAKFRPGSNNQIYPNQEPLRTYPIRELNYE
ncbi:hypothetical protein C7B61_00380 [filamentous cyanobacterium CCP1]|nr:hypothetical protein C7B61_00380 [filamentous cyanobacterium CCP1]